MNKLFISLIVFIAAIGAINWGLVGALHFNLVAYLFGLDSLITRVIYIVVGISGIALLFGIRCLLKNCCDSKKACENKDKSVINVDHNVHKKQQIHPHSIAKDQQSRFIEEGGNSQSLRK